MRSGKVDETPCILDFVKQPFRIQIKKGGKVLLWNQGKSRVKTGS